MLARLLVAFLLLPGAAWALCSPSIPVLGSLTCSSTQTGSLNTSASSQLGNTYTCGTPFAPLAQDGPEDVYEFTCQQSGTVNLDISNLSCDIDIYILNSTCNPNTGCTAGSTAASTTTDSVTFNCTAGQLYYVVIEGYEVPFGGCFGGASYTLTFDVSQSTGCPEDCNDGFDNDFDGLIDCDDPDCFGDPNCSCDNDGDGFDATACGGGDCDDNNPAVNPAAVEVCDGVDNNCNGVIDEGFDVDGDGYATCTGDCNDNDASINPGAIEIPYDGIDQDCDGIDPNDLDGDGFIGAPAGGPDCDDSDASVFPGANEAADFVDDDCDGTVDEGTEHYDDDGDGFTELAGDCDDGNAGVHPAALEICDSVDQDCDGVVDEGTECFDDDGDGYTELDGDCNDGDPNANPGLTEIDANGVDDDCDGVTDSGQGDTDGDGYTEEGGDCVEGAPDIYPGAPEECDGQDDDCDGEVDEGTECSDDDGDGFTEGDGDCHDGDPSIAPGVPEEIDGVDQDCDGDVDEGTDVFDDDGDGLSEEQGDCDDGDDSVFPGAPEVANGVDDDCDEQIDEGLDDADGDGFTTDDGDCDDAEGWVNPGMTEMCDGFDNDCDGDVDEDLDCEESFGDDDDAPRRVGCSCDQGGSGAAGLMGLLLVAGLGVRRRRSRLRPGALLLAPVLLAGCNEGAVTLSEVQRTLSVTPELVDVGVVYVGQLVPTTVTIAHETGGEVPGIEATVTNEVGDAFLISAAPPDLLDRAEEGTLTLAYSPLEVGYHWATVTVTSDSATPELMTVVRGQAVEPDFDVVPRSLDFGNVAAGDARALPVTVINHGPLPIEIVEALPNNAAFSTDAPLTVPAEGEAELTVTFTAATEDPETGLLSMTDSGGLPLPRVSLRANDCEHGDPLAYDVDQDGYTTCGGDCDDDDDQARPGLPEAPDQVDNDCDGIVDEGTELFDDDGDGFAEVDGDCNDGDFGVRPGGFEVLDNGVDDDCDGVVDLGQGDNDGDGYAAIGGDCDDAESRTYPGAPELADGLDNDCDGLIDEGTAAYDDDGDGFSEVAGDCDDGSADGATVYPGAPELADWIDNDCDGDVDEGTAHADDDGDGYTEFGGDCNDASPAQNPAQQEIVGNGLDDDCDGTAQ